MASRERSVERVYLGLVQDLSGLLEAARRSSARAVNSVMTTTYWEIGRRIVEFEQGGSDRAAYGSEVLARLGKDLSRRFGRGFSRRNLQQMRAFYQAYPSDEIRQTLSAKSASTFPLPWSHYTRLLGVQNPPVGLILSAEKNEALARYALDGLANEVLAREYRLVLPDERRLARELQSTRRRWERNRLPKI
jgi:hypothetical protein